jgi:SAM-dependent methyltransferase
MLSMQSECERCSSDGEFVSLWGSSLEARLLTKFQADYLHSLPDHLPSVEWVWSEMDRVWMRFGLDNRKPLDGQPIGDFYSHPVWLMNGIFTAQDSVSHFHRMAIARFIEGEKLQTIADYGGGFGELARVITGESTDALVSIIEPYPSEIGLERIKGEPRIRLVELAADDSYDAVVAQDVLEHVEDPIFLAYQMANAVKQGGTLIFANCFHPVIVCHLPSAFHLRHTFPSVMKSMGLRYLGNVEGAEHAQVFERTGDIDLKKARLAERVSRLGGPVLNRARPVLSRVKRLISRK